MMKIVYVTTYDPADIHAWSGIALRIKTALEEANIEVECVGNLQDAFRPFYVLKRLYMNKIRGQGYSREREPRVLQSYARQLETALMKSRADVVFSPGTIPIAYLRTTKPIVFWTDATFAGMVNFYPEWTNLAPSTLWNGNRMEQAALSACRLAIYSSDWAAQTAIENYSVDAAKIKIVPFGANVDRPLSVHRVRSEIACRPERPCNLLFVGVDWERKGGEDALRVAEEVKRRGLEVQLNIVGCVPPVSVPPFVKVHGFLSKTNPLQKEKLYGLYKSSHFFILPSRAECSAIVFAEASSFGLPSLSTDVGGTSTVVVNDKNGQIFSTDSFVPSCAEYIVQTFALRQRYEALCLSSFEEYRTRLNWHLAGSTVARLLDEYCR